MFAGKFSFAPMAPLKPPVFDAEEEMNPAEKKPRVRFQAPATSPAASPRKIDKVTTFESAPRIRTVTGKEKTGFCHFFSPSASERDRNFSRAACGHEGRHRCGYGDVCPRRPDSRRIARSSRSVAVRSEPLPGLCRYCILLQAVPSSSGCTRHDAATCRTTKRRSVSGVCALCRGVS